MNGFAAKHSEHGSATLSRDMPLRTAVLIPCLNEGPAIGRVVTDFQGALPGASIYVYDNASTDDTVAQARAAGAEVRLEPKRGKGNVVRRMFADVSADVYFLVDGDGTYDASSAPRMLAALSEQCCDMVNARRVAAASKAYRPGHDGTSRDEAPALSPLRSCKPAKLVGVQMSTEHAGMEVTRVKPDWGLRERKWRSSVAILQSGP